jgi:hypothetical protein
MLQDDVTHIGRMLRATHGLKGATMADQLRHGGRLLPRRVRLAAQRLADAELLVGMPKLSRQLDETALNRDYKICVQYLGPITQGRAHQPIWLRILSWLAWAIIAVLVVALLLFWAR